MKIDAVWVGIVMLAVLTSSGGMFAAECNERQYANAEGHFHNLARDQVKLIVIFRQKEKASVYDCDYDPNAQTYSVKGKLTFKDTDDGDYWVDSAATFKRDGSSPRIEMRSASLNIYGELLKKAAVVAGLAALAGAASSSSPNTAVERSGWEICNRSDEASVTLAVVHRSGSQWLFRGWWILAKGQCAKIISFDPGPNAYAYAYGRPGVTWDSDKDKWCAPPERFDYSTPPKECRPEHVKGFAEVKFSGSEKFRTTSLTNKQGPLIPNRE